MGTPLLPPQKGVDPEFSAHVYCGQTARWIKMLLGMEVDEDPVPLPKNGAEPPPQFLAHFYCGQTAGCIKKPLGMELGLSPEDFVLDGDQAPSPKRGRSSPNFRPTFILAKRLDGSRWHLAWR